MRVLMTSAPAVGHVMPLLPLGRALRDAGHAVHIATHPDVHPLIAKVGLQPLAAGMSGREMTQERARRWPETVTQPPTEWAVRMFATILAPTTLADLLEHCEQWQPDLIVHEEGDYAGPVAAARADIPWATHAWGSPLRPLEDLQAVNQHVGPLWASAQLPVPRWGGLYQHGLLNPCPPALQLDGFDSASTWPLRPGQPPEAPDRSPAVEWPADVYIGFGTVPLFAEDEDALTAAVSACVARGLRTVVTTSDLDQAARLGALHPSLVKGATFVSLASVLPSCRLVICHGGAGTVLAALAAGVPLVVVSKGTPSQTRMAAACSEAGVAVVTDQDPDSIAAAVARVLDAESFHSRAQEVAREIRAMPTPADVVPALIEVAARS